MNTTLTIKNFRVFDENGVDVQISPLTILTGCNSSGKSSIVKSIMLLDSFLKQAKRDHDNGERIRLEKYKLDFSTYPNNQLGRYDKIVNCKSESKKITFAYTIYSLLLSKEVNVGFVFNTDKNDELNNGFLESFTLSTEEGIIYSSGKQVKKICNLNLIKEDAIRFMVMEFLIQNYSNACGISLFEGNVSDEEVLEEKNRVQKFIDEIGKSRYHDVLNFMRHSDKKKTIAEESDCKPEVLEWTYNNSSYFYIPLVELLKDCQKENIEAKINDEVFSSKQVSEQVKEIFGKILKDFFTSDCHTFGEYFFMKETKFMENTVTGCFHPYSIYSNYYLEDVPSVSVMKYFEIPQNYLFNDPRMHGEPIATIGNDKNDEFLRRCGIEVKSPEEEKEISINKWLDTPVDFPILYEVLMEINKIYTDDCKNQYYKHLNSECMPVDSYNHYVFEALEIFTRNFVLECILPVWSSNVSYVSSSRIEVKRLYPLDDKTDFTLLLHKYFDGKRLYKEKANIEAVYGPIDNKGYMINSFTKTCLKWFGIGDSLIFDVDKDGLGVKIFLHHSDDTDDRLLADEGYGITQLVSIIMQIETAIISAKGEKEHSLWGFKDPEGYDTLKFYYEQQTIAIEEPEIHLHPRFQSLLADMFAYAMKNYNINFIIETHSEYLIRKMQLLVANGDVKSDDISLLYVNDPDENKRPDGEPQIKDIGICSDGYLNESFGPGFFDEASSLSRKLLK